MEILSRSGPRGRGISLSNNSRAMQLSRHSSLSIKSHHPSTPPIIYLNHKYPVVHKYPVFHECPVVHAYPLVHKYPVIGWVPPFDQFDQKSINTKVTFHYKNIQQTSALKKNFDNSQLQKIHELQKQLQVKTIMLTEMKKKFCRKNEMKNKLSLQNNKQQQQILQQQSIVGKNHKYNQGANRLQKNKDQFIKLDNYLAKQKQIQGNSGRSVKKIKKQNNGKVELETKKNKMDKSKSQFTNIKIDQSSNKKISDLKSPQKTTHQKGMKKSNDKNGNEKSNDKNGNEKTSKKKNTSIDSYSKNHIPAKVSNVAKVCSKQH